MYEAIVHPILLIHWNEKEGVARMDELVRSGFKTVLAETSGPACFRQIREIQPSAVIIDLSRLPSHGREVAVAMRNQKRSRTIPIVFVDGEPSKVEKIREKLPDAVYSTWRGIGGAVREAIRSVPADPARPTAMMESYKSTPLVKKLAIKENSTVHLIGAPQGFLETLGNLPEGADVRESSRGRADLRIWFVRARTELERGIDAAARNSQTAPLWIAWPKKLPRHSSDLTQQAVRETGLSAGLVDYKICSIDQTWSALLFTRKK